MPRRGFVLVTAVLAAGALALGLAAPTVGASTALKKGAPLCAGSTKKKAIAQIKKVWDQVLNGTTSLTLDQKFSGIQGADDPTFKQVLDDVAGKNAAMLKTTSERVNSVTCTGKKSATVKWDLVLSGTPSPGLAAPGTATIVKGQWKMARTTVCDLFGLADPSLLQSGPCAAAVAK